MINALKDKGLFDQEHFELLQERVREQEAFTKELEFRIDEHKRALDVVPQAIKASHFDLEEGSELAELTSVLKAHGGILRLFDAITDLGFERSGPNEEPLEDGKLYQMVKGINHKILKDVEHQVSAAAAAAVAAGSFAARASMSANVAATAAASANGDAVLVGAKVAGILSPHSPHSPYISKIEQPTVTKEPDVDFASSIFCHVSTEAIPMEAVDGVHDLIVEPTEPRGEIRHSVQFLGSKEVDLSEAELESLLIPDGPDDLPPDEITSVVIDASIALSKLESISESGPQAITESDPQANITGVEEPNSEESESQSSAVDALTLPVQKKEVIKEMKKVQIQIDTDTQTSSSTPSSSSSTTPKRTSQSPQLFQSPLSSPSKSTQLAAPSLPSSKSMSQPVSQASTPSQSRKDSTTESLTRLPPSLMRAIQDQLDTNDHKKIDKSDFNDLRREVFSVQADMAYRADIDDMLLPIDQECKNGSLSAKLRSLIESHFNLLAAKLPKAGRASEDPGVTEKNKNKLLVQQNKEMADRESAAELMRGNFEKLRTDFADAASAETERNKSMTSEMTKLRSDLYLELRHLEEQNMILKEKEKLEMEERTRKKEKAAAWRPEVAKINDSVKKFTADQVESLNQVGSLEHPSFISHFIFYLGYFSTLIYI